ncbi:hypothetical protein N9322_01250 [bacterium]|jgi:hypothetical protein|nr:hypothetical protein [bacterium]|tara:strand:+ start:361 stop:1329 length:969 start_codon:yes stop_codon:yes gene_type:complete
MKLKILKEQNKNYNLSILDFVRLLDPSKGGKFMRILLKELKFYDKSVALPQGSVWELSNQVEVTRGINEEVVNVLIDCLGGVDAINDLEKFEVLCDENLIAIKDVQEYKSLGEISLAVIDAEEKRCGSKPIKKIILDSSDYTVIKPLNVFASRKYGASTKWCTSSKEPKTFYEYSKKGVLLYILSKHNDKKWAVYYDIKLKELSWWNSKDILTDGYLVDLPENLKIDILKYILNEDNPNSHYFDENTKSLSEQVSVGMTDSDGDYQEVMVTPEPFNGVWRNGSYTQNEYAYTSTEDKIDGLVNKTLEYHYTIDALSKGGEEM